MKHLFEDSLVSPVKSSLKWRKVHVASDSVRYSLNASKQDQRYGFVISDYPHFKER